MFKFISMKNISATMIALSMLLGTLAVSPVATAYAKPSLGRALGKAYYAKQGALVTRHNMKSFVFDGSPYLVRGRFRNTFRIGNRSFRVR